jgi:putative membrane protein
MGARKPPLQSQIHHRAPIGAFITNKNISMEHFLSNQLLNAAIFSALGIVIWLVGYYIIERITPENTWAEIVKNKNTAVAIIFAAMILAIAIIIGAAIHG